MVPICFTQAIFSSVISDIGGACGLQEVSLTAVIDAFRGVSQPSRVVTKPKFKVTIRDICMNASDQNLSLTSDTYDTLDVLYDVLSTRCHDNKVDASSICRVLSAFCSVDSPDCAKLLYHLLDIDGDGHINFSDLRSSLSFMFYVLGDLAVEYHIFEQNDIKELADSYAQYIFDEQNINVSSVIGRTEFQTWLQSRSRQFIDISVLDHPLKHIDLDMSALTHFKNTLGLTDVAPSVLAAYLSSFAESSDGISLQNVFAALVSTYKVFNVFPGHKSLGAAEKLIQWIFSLYDIHGAGHVDLSTLSSALCFFTDTPWAVQAAAFFSHKKETQGSLCASSYDMIQYLESLFRLLLEFKKEYCYIRSKGSLASVMVENAIICDQLPQTNGSISIYDFARWLHSTIDLQNGRINIQMEFKDALADTCLSSETSTCSEPPRQGTPEQSTVSHDLQVARSLLGLRGFTAEDLMDTLGECAQEGLVSVPAWQQVLTHLCNLTSTSKNDMDDAVILGTKIFNALDRQDSGFVSYATFVAAVSILCDSPADEKLLVAFMVMMEENGNRIAISAVTEYFGAVLSIIFTCSEEAFSRFRRCKTDIDLTAEGAVRKCLSACGYANKNALTMEEFCQVAGYCLQIAENGSC